MERNGPFNNGNDPRVLNSVRNVGEMFEQWPYQTTNHVPQHHEPLHNHHIPQHHGQVQYHPQSNSENLKFQEGEPKKNPYDILMIQMRKTHANGLYSAPRTFPSNNIYREPNIHSAMNAAKGHYHYPNKQHTGGKRRRRRTNKKINLKKRKNKTKNKKRRRKSRTLKH